MRGAAVGDAAGRFGASLGNDVLRLHSAIALIAALLLVEDATESYFAEFKAATLAMIAAQGAIVGWHAPSRAVLEALLA